MCESLVEHWTMETVQNYLHSFRSWLRNGPVCVFRTINLEASGVWWDILSRLRVQSFLLGISFSKETFMKMHGHVVGDGA